MDDLPYKAEYAKSNRSSCKGCKMTIGKDSLRIGVMVQSPVFDGKVPNWHHKDCFFRKNRPKACTEIEHFDALRWEDQKAIKDIIGGGGGGGGGGSGRKSGGNSMEKTLYTVEYAKSNRSTCKGCEVKIDKGVIRFGVKDFDSHSAKQYGPLDRWHHVECLEKNREELEIPDDLDVTKVNGFKSLNDDDRADLKKRFKVSKSKKRKAEDDVEKEDKKRPKVDNAHEEALQEQSKMLWKLRDRLAAEVTTDAYKGLLEYNHQGLATGESRLLDRVVDAMLFGPLKPCPECEGQLVYSATGYFCSGMATEWTKCLYKTRSVKRGKFRIPDEYMDADVLRTFKFKKRERLLPYDEETAASMSQPVVETSRDGDSGGPLAGMKFVVAKVKFGSGKGQPEIQEELRKLGAVVEKKVDSSTVAVIATQEAVDAMKPKLMNEAKAADVHVIKEDFVGAVAKGGAALLIQSNAISSWGSDPLARIEKNKSSKSTLVGKSKFSKSSEDRFKKEMSTLKMKVKGGAAVDPESGLEDSAHIMQESNGDPLNAVLGMVDLVRGSNSYYKLQALEADSKNRWYVFRAWGRIGTSIGGNKLEKFHSKEGAKEQFCYLYEDKTGKSWSARKSSEKIPNKFYPLELDYGEEDETVGKIDLSVSNSKLERSVQELIRFIFDIESMKQTMLEFEIDLKKMPLGKLSRSQIEKAYSVLTELNKMMSATESSNTKLMDATTRFYTLIPHDFGMRKPPLLDTTEVIKAKTEMLDNLLEIEIAYNMMKTGHGEDPVDAHYNKLKSNIVPLDKDSEEYKRLVEYVANTHAPTHSSYTLEVQEIFDLEREGEVARYKPFTKMHNRMLLWHGSRRTNWAGIISQGLRIAPPEAPVTGYMFGKGIYFADMVSKSANYCFTNRANPEGIMLLCEVALGNMTERTSADPRIALNAGEHSCKGIGSTCPDPSGFYTRPDNVVYPMGKCSRADISYTSLLYNEYIVYDVAQVRQKYLLRMKFNYK